MDVNLEINKINPTILIVDIEGGEKDLIPIIDFEKSEIKKIIIELHPHIIGKKASSNVLSNIISQDFMLNLSKSKNNVYMFEK